VKEFWANVTKERETKAQEWEGVFSEYAKSNPEKFEELERSFSGYSMSEEDLLAILPKFEYGKDKEKATHQFSEQCLNILAPLLPELIGGSADLNPSNLTALKCSGDFQKDSPTGRYLRFGVREHGMAAICNGMLAYGGFRPFYATFLNFTGYALGAIRLSALSRFGIIYIMTHDSIGLGEDGPTHQPVEMLESLRSMPNINVFRPADSKKVAAAYSVAIRTRATPSVICCSRMTVAALKSSSVEKSCLGAYDVVSCEEIGRAHV
jgi:transketolase